MPERYWILKRDRMLWADLGEFPGGYPEAAVLNAAETHGAGEYLVFNQYGHDRFTVTARTEYEASKVEPEPTLVERVVRAT